MNKLNKSKLAASIMLSGSIFYILFILGKKANLDMTVVYVLSGFAALYYLAASIREIIINDILNRVDVVTACWANLRNTSKMMYLTKKITVMGNIFYTVPRLGLCSVVEIKDGYSLSHPALSKPITVSVLDYDKTPEITSDIKLYVEV